VPQIADPRADVTGQDLAAQLGHTQDMALRSLLGCLCVSLVVTLASAGCKGDKGKAQGGLDARCEALAKACGDSDKHIEELATGCKEAAAKQAKACTDNVTALYDCYEKELCGKTDKVWVLNDLRVLSDRKGKCVAERTAVTECTSK
jgi:hypothetical protein